MAVLTINQLENLRQLIASKIAAINYNKSQANLALQAIEDWFEANKALLSAAIDTATAPLVLTVAQKKLFVAVFILQKAGREGA